MLLGDQTTVAHQSDNMTSWGNQIRFDETFHRGSGGRKRSQLVICWIIGGIVVAHGTNGDDIGQVTRHTNGHGIRTGIACRSHHHDAGSPGCHYRLIQRIIPIIGLGRRAKREIEDPDVVDFLITDQPVDATNDIRIAALAIFIESLYRHKSSIGGNPAVMIILPGKFAVETDTLNMRTVTILVGRLPHGKFLIDNGIVLRQRPQ